LPASVSDTSWNQSTTLLVEESEGQPRLYLGRGVGDRVAVGLLSSSGLWRGGDLVEPYVVCAFAPSIDTPLHCSMELPADVLASLRTADPSSGVLDWTLNEQLELASFSNVPVSPRLQRPDLRVVVSQPRLVAFAAVEQLRDLYLPTLGAVCPGIARSSGSPRRILLR
jgi:hypothetical protein